MKVRVHKPYADPKANAAFNRGRKARRDRVNWSDCPESKYVSAWRNGWDCENVTLRKGLTNA